MAHYADTFDTYLEINGYEYEAKIDFTIYDKDDIEFSSFKIKDDQGEWEEFPYLQRVEDSITEEIIEYVTELMVTDREMQAEAEYEDRRDKVLDYD